MLVLEPPFNTWISVGGPIFSLGDFTLFPGQGYFGSSGEYELWRSDGTDAGTFSLGVSLPDNWSLRETSAVRGGVLLFANSTPGHGEELWRSDGTPAGTFLLVETVAGPDSKPLGPFATAGATVFFVAGGAELWKNDAGGTSLVRALPGNPTIGIRSLTAVGNRVYFSYDDGTHGRELWMSDGTEAGTRMGRRPLPRTRLLIQGDEIGPRLLLVFAVGWTPAVSPAASGAANSTAQRATTRTWPPCGIAESGNFQPLSRPANG